MTSKDYFLVPAGTQITGITYKEGFYFISYSGQRPLSETELREMARHGYPVDKIPKDFCDHIWELKEVCTKCGKV